MVLCMHLCLGTEHARAQSTARISVDALGNEANNASGTAVISGNGLVAAFESQASNLVPGDVNGVRDVFVVELETGAIELVSLGSLGETVENSASRPSLSHDGRLVAFHSPSALLVPGDTNGMSDVFVRDRMLGTLRRISLASDGSQGNGISSFAALSGDGRWVAFLSSAPNLVAGDGNLHTDVFLHELATGLTTRISTAVGGGDPNGYSFWPTISSDGRRIAFQSFATNLVTGDTNGSADIFLYDRLSGGTQLVSAGLAGSPADGQSSHPALSGDGRFVAFTSIATNLIAGDLNGFDDVFVRDLLSGSIERVSVTLLGAEADNWSAFPFINGDGRFVGFGSKSDTLVAGDSNAVRDLFVRDRLAQTTEQLSLDGNSVGVDDESSGLSISADGTRSVFQSDNADLVPNDLNLRSDVFLRARGAFFAQHCFGDGSQGLCPCANAGLSGRGCAHSFDARGARLAAGGEPTLDSVVIAAHELPPSALCILLQGSQTIPAASFGDGLRCAGGQLLRLYSRHASLGSVSLPGPFDTSLAARSAQLGAPIPTGAQRCYQFYFRDAAAGFCPAPQGSTFNTSPAITIQY
jgi:Tol biopolymer transport system component